MSTQIFLGKPPAGIEQWIKDHHVPVVKETTVVKYTAESGLSDWEGDIVGELTDSSIPNISNIEVVEIGSHVTSIGDWAFSGCSGLTTVTIPDGMMNIGNFAFSSCNGLTSVTIPDGVTSIGECAFSECSRLASVTIPNSVTSIGQITFYNCDRLASITFSGKDKATVQGMSNYSWNLPSGCIIHCTDGDITI